MAHVPTRPVDGVPGSDLVTAGLADLEAGRETIEAMLVAGASERLRDLGFRVAPTSISDPELRLYQLLEGQVGSAGAHSAYNALRRRLLSFLISAADVPAG